VVNLPLGETPLHVGLQSSQAIYNGGLSTASVINNYFIY